MKMIVVDADFFSSLTKIKRLHLLHELFKSEICVPMGVKNEIQKCSDIYSEVRTHNWLKVVKTPKSKRKVVKEIQEQNFGLGESECIIMGDIILMSDTKAGRYAYELGKKIIDIPTFLLLCKKSCIIDQVKLERIIRDLELMDNYRFSKEWLKKLL